MKKFLCIFFCAFILLFSGCEKIKDVENEPLEISGFNTIIKTVANDVEIKANVEYVPFDTLTLAFLLPNSAENMQVICKNGEYTISTEKLTFTMHSDKIPFSAVCKTLEECINTVQGTIPEKDAENNLLIFTYNADGHLCKLYTKTDTKNFVKLSVDGADFLFFENFEYIMGQTA